MCPRTPIFVLILLCFLVRLYLSSYYSICVLILLYMCPHTTVCVLILLYMCPHTTVYVSSYYSICVLILLCICHHTLASSYDGICVLILLYMCPDIALCTLSNGSMHAFQRLLCARPHAPLLPHMCPHTITCASSYSSYGFMQAFQRLLGARPLRGPRTRCDRAWGTRRPPPHPLSSAAHRLRRPVDQRLLACLKSPNTLRGYYNTLYLIP
jgi:hypothetical protein